MVAHHDANIRNDPREAASHKLLLLHCHLVNRHRPSRYSDRPAQVKSNMSLPVHGALWV
jgi:hypothetical protein